MSFLLLEFNTDQLQEVRKLSDTQNFISEVQNNLTQDKTFTQSYEEVEQRHIHIFGQRRYSDYRSFCTVRKRYI